MKSIVFKFIGCAGVCGALLMAAGRGTAATAEQFATPEAAVKALSDAAAARDTNEMCRIFGPESRALASTDVVQSSNRFTIFAQRIAAKANLKRPAEDKVLLEIGLDAWPFPVPLVRRDGQWSFDLAAGREEILNRRIGADELGAISVCHGYVDAQREYASVDRMGDCVLQYAQSLRSKPGKHDGLYWHAGEGEEISPFGPLIAASHLEGYHKETKIMASAQSPYHGYYFKILTRQGRSAPGGKYNYIINGRMIAGFAMVAWPAQWGNSGIMTFMVNQQGRVFEKNLGPKTGTIAPALAVYDPDPTWKSAWEP
jgi:hypothetical protein